jgi:hypothetical protein
MKSSRLVIMICAFLINTPVLMAADPGPATGIVAETIEAGGYVYLRLENGIWIAANTFAVSRGDEVQYSGGMEMTSFHSKSLDRTFDSILFVSEASLVSINGDDTSAAAMEGHGGMGMPLKKPASAIAPAPGEITALQDGKTVAAIFAESAGLKGQVVAKGTVVTDVDLGYGYNYKVLLEEATFSPGVE